MRVVVQRVLRASVRVEGSHVAAIGPGLVVLLGARAGDTPDEAAWLAAKVGQLRVFGDQTGKMNRSLADVGGEVLAVPNFTLYGDCQRGRRPDFSEAAEAAAARGLFGAFCRGLERQRIVVRQGAFGAHMQLEILNDGPVTLLLDTDEIQR